MAPLITHMHADHASLGNRAFGECAETLIDFSYRSHQEAVGFLQSALRGPGGIGLLHGPDGAGKTFIARGLATQLARDSDVALLDGTHLKPRDLMVNMLTQYGYETGSSSDGELLQTLSDTLLLQTRSWQPPTLIIDNVDRMYPSALSIVNTLATLALNGRSALRLLFTGHGGLPRLVDSDGMKSVAERGPAMFDLKPLTAKEAMIYLHARLQAAGSERADTVFPFDVCDQLHAQSGGWPGRLNKSALETMQRATNIPVSIVDTHWPGEQQAESEPELPVLGNENAVAPLRPRLIITRDGKTLASYAFGENKVMIGRSDFADLVIEDDYVSKIHCVLLLYTDALVLLDLNSANGTTVNSVKTRKTILRNNDIISLGHHRLKIENAPAISPEMQELLRSPDTLKMKNLVDVRRQRARRRVMAGRGPGQSR